MTGDEWPSMKSELLTHIVPKTQVILLKMAIFIIVIGLVALTARIVFVYFSESHSVVNLLLAAFLIFLSWSLWTLKIWARKAIKFVIVLAIFIAVAGIFNPFYASDYQAEHNGESPDWLALLTYIGPAIAIGLWFYWVLEKHAKEFG